MSTPPTVTVDSNDWTEYVQDRSMSVKLGSADFTLIGPPAVPYPEMPVVITDPDWTGTITNVEGTTYSGVVPTTWWKIRATNVDQLEDTGAAPFDISDAPDLVDSFPWKGNSLTVTRTFKDSVEEVRAKCDLLVDGTLVPGMLMTLTAAEHELTAEQFTIMDVTTTWDTEDGAVYSLDLGLGDFEEATTSAADGGPLDPIGLDDVFEEAIDDSIDGGSIGDAIGDAIAAADNVRGYSSIHIDGAIGTDAFTPLEDIPIAVGQVGLVWWITTDAYVGKVVVTQVTGTLSIVQGKGFAHVVPSVSGTFDVVADATSESVSVHVIVCPLGFVFEEQNV